MNKLPLYSFFQALRKNGFSLGINEYYALLDALQLGYGIDQNTGTLDRTRTLKLCKALWYKPNQSKFAFEDMFDECFAPLPSDGAHQPVHVSSIDNDLPQKKPHPIAPTPQDEALNAPLPSQQAPETLPLVKFILKDINDDSEVVKIPDTAQPPKQKFLFDDDYFSLHSRQMIQACRFLPLYQYLPDNKELDIQETTQRFAQDIFFASPVFKKKKVIANQVLLLIDHEGSMLAFEPLAQAFAHALHEAFKTYLPNHQDRVAQYYFYNVPQDYGYHNPAHTRYTAMDKIVHQLTPQHSVILLSDAGAARGGNSSARFRATLRCLIQLKKATHKVVWLNPMPEERWEGTTAQRIARFVPMFALDTPQNLQRAINHLRGKQNS